MNGTPIQEWQNGVIYKKQNGAYVHSVNGNNSQGYDSVDELVKGETKDSGTQATEVQSNKTDETDSGDTGAARKSKVATDESPAKTTRKKTSKKSK